LFVCKAKEGRQFRMSSKLGYNSSILNWKNVLDTLPNKIPDKTVLFDICIFSFTAFENERKHKVHEHYLN
jgi:hypothetical protein